MERLDTKAIVQAIREAAATAAARFPREAEVCGNPRQAEFAAAVSDAIRPIIAGETIAGLWPIQLALTADFNGNAGPDYSAINIGTHMAMNLLDEFAATAPAATIEDVQARLAFFVEGEEEDYLAERLWKPFTVNLARDLCRIKTGDIGHPAPGATFGEFVLIRETEDATA